MALLSHVFVYSASTRRAGRRPGVSDHRIGPLLRRIAALRGEGRHVLVSVHWGLEYAFEPVPYQALQARAMVGAGASLILGHGPHYPQHVESCGNAQIVHSLGNFIFDEPHAWANKTFIYGASLDAAGRVLAHQVHPVRIRDGVPELMRAPEARMLHAKLAAGARASAAQTRAQRQRLHALYLRDISWRVCSMRSLKFAALPPLAFYGDIGLGNLLRKLRPANFLRGLRRSAKPAPVSPPRDP